jgi:hypothetical protein
MDIVMMMENGHGGWLPAMEEVHSFIQDLYRK